MQEREGTERVRETETDRTYLSLADAYEEQQNAEKEKAKGK